MDMPTEADAPADGPVRFDTKIAVMLRDDLEVWQRLNVTAFLVSGIGWRVPEVLLSGHHARIAEWRLAQSRARAAQAGRT